MLTQHRYTTQRARLTRDTEIAQRQLDAAAEDTARRKAALATVRGVLAEAPRAVAELQAVTARYRELVASLRASDQAIRRALAPVVREPRAWEQLDLHPVLVPA